MFISVMTKTVKAKKKAVRVLRSVRNNRQSKVAEAYASRALSFLLAQNALDMYKEVQVARAEMRRRLDKPRYTLKDGEWVRKTATQKMAQKFSKEFDAHRAGAVLSMASRHIPFFDPCQTSGRC